MAWMTLAILSTVLASAFSLLSKEFIEHRVRSYVTLYFLGGLFQVGLSIVILALLPWGGGPPWWALALGAGLGLWNALLYLAIVKALSMEDVTRVMPVVDSYPLFVAFLAAIFLGEAITIVKLMAVVTILSGMFLASWHRALPGGRVRLSGVFYLLLMASVGLAVYNVTAKYLLAYVSPWHLYTLTLVGGLPIIIAMGVRSGAWREALGLVRRPGAPTWLFLLIQTAGVSSFILWFFAASRGPVSLVSAVSSTRPVMVLAYVALAQLVADVLRHRPLLLGAYRTRGAGVLLVSLGVSVLSIT